MEGPVFGENQTAAEPAIGQPVIAEPVMTDSMDKLHGNTDFTQLAPLATYSWNIFRYIGDYLHLFGILVLLVTIGWNKSVAGISRSTQILYFSVFVTRYLDLFDHTQSLYLVVFKLTYIGTSLAILACFFFYASTYERRHDTCNLAIIVAPCAITALLLTNEFSILEVLWTFSEFIEGFAMVPQYIFCYRSVSRHWGQSMYVISMGGYRVFYVLNWIYKKMQMPNYNDIQSWIGGIIEILFFLDFLSFRFTGYSMLRKMSLSVDTKINEISEKVELKVMGSTRAERSGDTSAGGAVRRRKRVGDTDDAGDSAV